MEVFCANAQRADSSRQAKTLFKNISIRFMWSSKGRAARKITR
jgi:hypothetical protein